MALSTPLYFHVVHNRLGPVLSAETGFQLAEQPDTVLGPDISFAEADTLDLSEVVAGFQIPLAEVFA